MDSAAQAGANLPAEIEQYYNQFEEAERLMRPRNQVELIRTYELLARYLPAPPAVVLDVGGGSGVYAFWLARRGYTVHLIDAMPRHIAQAQAAAQRQPDQPLASIQLGDARRLEFGDQSADAVLLFGPLYHLTARQDRQQALAEAARVLRPGGRVLAVGISRYISTINALLEGLIDDAAFGPVYRQDLRDGQHRSAGNRFFTTAFFHRPDELRAEIEEAGLRTDALVAVEGPAKLLSDFERRWQDAAQQARLLEIIRQIEAVPYLMGVSTHILAAATKVG